MISSVLYASILHLISRRWLSRQLMKCRFIGILLICVCLSGCAKETYQQAELESETNVEKAEIQDAEMSDAGLPDSQNSISELQRYRLMHEDGELSLDELDDIRAKLRLEAAGPYVDQILEEYQGIYKYNDRTIGYIHIDDTVIDGPVLQTLEDYEYYLHRDIDGHKSEPGCIILDADSEIGIGTAAAGYLEEYAPTPIQLVHGHNMRNGTMFGSLLEYQNEDYGRAHSIIKYDSIYEKREYELVCVLFSQIYPEDEEVFKYYDIEGIDTAKEAYEWYTEVQKLALYQTDVTVSPGDELIVLSTCSYHTDEGRFAVVGRRTNNN